VRHLRERVARRRARARAARRLRGLRTPGATVAVRRVAGAFRAVRVEPAPSPALVAQANLELLAGPLREEGVDFFLVPGFSAARYRLGVAATDRSRVFAALARAHATRPVYVTPLAPADPPGEPLLARELSAVTPSDGDALVWRVFETVQTPDGGWTLGARFAAELELWTEEPDGSLRAPRRNRYAPAVPPEQRRPAPREVGARTYPTLAPFCAPHVDDVHFPVDVVYTWVDPTDPQWARRKAEALGSVQAGQLTAYADSDARFTDRDELRYSLRSLEEYAPWVRHVWLVTAGQTPAWLRPSDRLTVVDHAQIWHPDGVLPTFNSHAIEANLHRVPGLAEHFLYLNDDVFFGRAVRPDLFFHPNGITKFFYSRQQLGLQPAGAQEVGPVAAGRNNRALIERRFGRTITQRMYHTPHPLRRSVLAEMEREFPEEFRQTARSVFRRSCDITAAGSLHHYYAYCSARAVPATMSYGYLDLTDPAVGAGLAETLRKRPYDTFCVNDLHFEGVDEAALHRLLGDFLERYFPRPSSFEQSR
jgi:hypothetical protein